MTHSRQEMVLRSERMDALRTVSLGTRGNGRRGAKQTRMLRQPSIAGPASANASTPRASGYKRIPAILAMADVLQTSDGEAWPRVVGISCIASCQPVAIPLHVTSRPAAMGAGTVVACANRSRRGAMTSRRRMEGGAVQERLLL